MPFKYLRLIILSKLAMLQNDSSSTSTELNSQRYEYLNILMSKRIRHRGKIRICATINSKYKMEEEKNVVYKAMHL